MNISLNPVESSPRKNEEEENLRIESLLNDKIALKKDEEKTLKGNKNNFVREENDKENILLEKTQGIDPLI